MVNWIEIDCEALRRNAALIQEKLPSGCHIAAVVKGDAYGHGIDGVVRTLSPLPSVELFVVSSLEEALQALRAGTEKQVLILNRILGGELRDLLAALPEPERRRAAAQMVFSVYAPGDVARFAACGEIAGAALKVHLRLDFSSGMRGLSRRDYQTEGERLLSHPGVRMQGMYAHVYSTYVDPAEGEQEIRMYMDVFDSLPPELRARLKLHLLSSTSCFHFPEASYDLVRIGASLYGLPVRDDTGVVPEAEPVMSICARVVSCVDVVPGGRTDYTNFLDPDVKRVALISVGNWDIPGFFASRWHAGGIVGADNQVRIGSHLCHMVGTPCMDTCCVNITGVPDVRIGDEVVVLGPYPGVTLREWIDRTGFGLEDCQMLFSGMYRPPRRYVHLT